eukprot:366052-Chlamydomonas_euryale.AAC.20
MVPWLVLGHAHRHDMYFITPGAMTCGSSQGRHDMRFATDGAHGMVRRSRRAALTASCCCRTRGTCSCWAGCQTPPCRRRCTCMEGRGVRRWPAALSCNILLLVLFHHAVIQSFTPSSSPSSVPPSISARARRAAEEHSQGLPVHPPPPHTHPVIPSCPLKPPHGQGLAHGSCTAPLQGKE